MNLVSETSSPAAVRSMQTWLNWNGDRLAVDGVCGPKTLAAQARAGARALPAVNGVTPEAKRALKVALSAVGEEELDGSNLFAIGSIGHRLTDGWAETVKAGTTDALRPPYCAIFASACVAIGMDAKLPEDTKARAIAWGKTPWKRWFGAVADWDTWSYADDRQYLRRRSAPETGTIYTMNRQGSGSDPGRGGHCGLVLAVRGGRFLAVDANVDGGVRLVVRSGSDVRGFVRWWVTL